MTVTRTRNNVQLGVWQLSDEQQSELRSALSDKPGIEILDVAPRVASVKSSPSERPLQPAGPLHVIVDSGDDDRLFKFFGSSEREQVFTSKALSDSSGMLSHLYALRNLQSQFPPEREQVLSPEDRVRLAGLVRDHADAIASALDALDTQLAPLDSYFHVMPSSTADSSSGIPWQRKSVDSLQTGRDIDHLLRALLTTSQEPASPDSALPQIQQNMSSLKEKLEDLVVSTR